jgi:hypothetical protein
MTTLITMKTTGLNANAVASITSAVTTWKAVILLPDDSFVKIGVATA